MIRRNSDRPPRQHAPEHSTERTHHRLTERAPKKKRVTHASSSSVVAEEIEGDRFFAFINEESLNEALRALEKSLAGFEPKIRVLAAEFRHGQRKIVALGIVNVEQYDLKALTYATEDAQFTGVMVPGFVLTREKIPEYIKDAHIPQELDLLTEKVKLIPSLIVLHQALDALSKAHNWRFFGNTPQPSFSDNNHVVVETPSQKIYDDIVAALRQSGLALGRDFNPFAEEDPTLPARTLVIKKSVLLHDPEAAQRLLAYAKYKATDMERGGRGRTG